MIIEILDVTPENKVCLRVKYIDDAQLESPCLGAVAEVSEDSAKAIRASITALKQCMAEEKREGVEYAHGLRQR